jgi:hypothetical protein
MSNGFAIAAVTATIRRQIDEGLSADKVGDVTGAFAVTAIPPDRIVKANQPEPIQVNLFLHQVTHNAAWRNVDLPSRDSDGDVVRIPPVAINLHYLVSAYGPDPYIPEILLGHTVRILAENATLSREAIRRMLTPSGPDPMLTALLGSDLDDQPELIKIAPETVNTEEMSRLWSTFQSSYRPSVAYQVSVVLIDGRGRARPSLPIRSRGVSSDVLAVPELVAIEAASGPLDPIDTESAVVLSGRGLVDSDGVRVQFGTVTRDLAAADMIGETLKVDLAADPRPLAGVTGVRVLHSIPLGEPPVAHDAYVSNTVAAIIRPTISSTSRTVGSTETIDGVDYAAGTFKVTVSRPIGSEQKVELLLNEFGAPADRTPRGYVLPFPPGNGIVSPATEAATLEIAYSGIARFAYLVRLRVDGAESLLTTGGDGRFNAPQRTI